MFSKRTAWDLTPNQLAQRREALTRAGVELLDLTESNPTRCGFRYPDALLAPLADPAALRYAPSPLGLPAARAAVAARYSGVDPAHIVLTASTSEAYHVAFRLLCNPGDQVLVPAPSYPLFEYLARLDDVQPVPYPLRYGDRWAVDLDAVAAMIMPSTKALIAVHPNNPTGSCLTRAELACLGDLCRRHGLALIADEVFADYRWTLSRETPATLLGTPGVLTIALGGLSKTLGLPQMKLAWMAVSGPPALRDAALARLELIADTYLSVNTPAQQALPAWLALAPAIQSQIRRRVTDNRQWLAGQGLPGAQLLTADGGWSAVLRVPSVRDEEAWVVRLLEQERVVVHPGYFFEFAEPGYLVVSLLPSPETFRAGITRLAMALAPSRGSCYDTIS